MIEINPIIIPQKTTKLPIEIYPTVPTQFIINNYPKLLPTWKQVPKSVLIVLLYAKLSIENINQDTQAEKERLKQEFLQLGNDLKYILQKENYFIEIIDPQDGKPINSHNATMNFDLIAIVNQILGFNYYHTQQGCKVLNHPTQKTGIYPSILLSDTDPIKIDDSLKKSILLTSYISTRKVNNHEKVINCE
ncbi:methylmalonic aciduria and homocystinuria type D protein [Cyanothece sp. BG0011]|uniref:methylmalonic aciduria and homocystinuria type D protein n=1 Tax=Cyanothece sp. BG0011 TaxID=2082950 RepID=UPI0018E57439|nr:methylmalonic aciduria and homocystinuria type D protein [Cyanothece sp. BG0011]